MLHIYCKSPRAVLLLGCFSEEGPMRFPLEPGPLPGMVLNVDPSYPINEQLIKKALTVINLPTLQSRHITVEQEFCETFTPPDGIETTLYLATIDARHRVVQLTWPTMPDILRSMPKNRARLPYLKSWQVLTGALTESTKAVDIEELIKYFDS